MAQTSRATAAWLTRQSHATATHPKAKTPVIMSGVTIHVAFESKVEAGGNKRNPAVAEVSIWKQVLTQTAEQFSGKASLGNTKAFKASETNPTTRVVKFTIPQKHEAAFRETLEGANFTVGATARVLGFNVLGEAQAPIVKGQYPEIKPLMG